MADRRNHRILIQVTDDEIADEALGSVMSTMLRPNKLGLKCNGSFSYPLRVPSQNYNADVDVLNCTTLSLTRKNQQGACTNEIMCFDCVGRTDSDPLVRNEISNMFDLLMIDQQNCCLVHFKPLREYPTSFFNILVPEVDKRLVILRSTLILESIKLEYYDVQKYDVVNMFQKNRHGPNAARNDIVFHNTRELLRWTQRSYNNLWVTGSEHDCFELEFVFVEAPNDLESASASAKKYTAKLSILQFYLNKIDGNMRVGLQKFFENMHHNNSRVNQSIITDYLREYFSSKSESWLIWMMFDVPQINYGSSLVNDMLTLARAVYKDGNSDKGLINHCEFNMIFNSPSGKSMMPRVGGGNLAVAQRKLQSANNNPPCNIKVPTIKMGNYSLSFWYCRIEESFLNVIASMERYYDRKYDLKVQKMCNDLKYTTRNIDKDLSSTNVNVNVVYDKDISADEILRSYFKQYRDALAAFRVLVQKVERSKYANQLNVFIGTKNDEINKQTRQMKVRLLELCQARLSSAIKDEMKTINTEVNPSIKVSGNITKTTKKNF